MLLPGDELVDVAREELQVDEPFDARDLAWRQFRMEDSRTDYDEPDDIFTYVPTMRKSRRAAQSCWSTPPSGEPR